MSASVHPDRAGAPTAADVDVQGIVPTFVAPWPLPGRSWIDLAVLFVLGGIAVFGFGAALAGTGFLVAGLGGLALGIAVGVLSHALRIGALLTALVTIAAFFLFGSAIAMPAAATLGLLPNLTTLGGLAVGSVFGWKDFVTLATPLSAPAYIMTLPYLAALLVGVVGSVLAVRWLPRRPQIAVRCAVVLLGPVVLFATVVLLGTSSPYFAALRGIAFAVIALVWLGWRPAAGRGRNVAASASAVLRRQKVVGVAAVAGMAVLIGGGVAVVTTPAASDRYVLREVVTPPFDPFDYPSPLSGFRTYTKDLDQTPLFTATGLQPGDRLRLAAMDSYDGKLWTVAGPSTATDGSGAFELVGSTLPQPDLVTSGGRRDVTIDVAGYQDIWMPGVGYLSTLQLDGKTAENAESVRYNAESGAAVLTTGLAKGDRFEATAETQQVPSDTTLASTPTAQLDLPPVTNVPDVVVAKASELVGSETAPMAQLRAMEQSLRTTGFLSHGLASDASPSRAGHGADRMAELFTRTPMVGDQEQYASAFALMARSLGYPARVVMGFAPKVTEGQRSVTVTGHDVTAWVEVPFEGYGWVSFSPTPDDTEIPQDQDPKPKTEPQPQVRQPPRSDNLDDSLLTDAAIDDGDDEDKKDPFAVPVWVWWAAGIVLVPLALYVVPLLAVAAAKRRRVRRRRDHGTGDARAAGAWDELVDRYAELGYTIPLRVTRSGVATSLGEQSVAVRDADDPLVAPEDSVPGTRTDVLGDGLRDLARRADAAVFSGEDVPPEAAERLWTETDARSAAALAEVGWFRRRLSSFRYRSARTVRSVLRVPERLSKRIEPKE
ncbi:transglutaminase domain-containing protein [Plantibacter sp. Mn2098]|uniref:transglutaminase family protein n=1 Tax=Plantibacter sp. Mn2098 TaxID=3395266 RepID=UPI003BE37D97